MDGISLSWRLLPEVLIERHHLQSRIISRGEGAEREIRFLYRDPQPLLPVWIGEELRVISWGPGRKLSRLAKSRVIAQETLQSGEWRELHPEPVDIPASFGWDKGIWYPVKQGVRGVLVHDEAGTQVAYVVTKVATHYYEIMTRNKRQPVMFGETI